MTTDSTRRRIAIVTGGTGGVGSRVSMLLAESGYEIAFTYYRNVARRDELLGQLAERGVRATAHRVDLTVAEDAARFVEDVVESSGSLDALVHAAGPIVPQQYLSQVTPELFAHHLQNEVAAFFHLVRPALPALRDSRGSIVAVTTVAVRHLPVRDSLSSVPKAGVEAMVRAIAKEEGPLGVRANCVGPGILADGMAASLAEAGDFDAEAQAAAIRSIPLRRFGTTGDVADAVAFLARSGYITGQSLDVDGGYGL